MNNFMPYPSEQTAELIADTMVNRGWLVRSGSSNLLLKKYQGSDRIWVKDRFVELDKGNNIKYSFPIDANGVKVGGFPSSSTSYWVYLQNGDVDNSNLACCLTSPADYPYLGVSGDAAKWRIVGSVKFDGSTNVAEDWHVGSWYHQDSFGLSASTTITGATSTDHTVYEFDDIMMMPGQQLSLGFNNSFTTTMQSDITMKIIDTSTEVVASSISVPNALSLYCNTNLIYAVNESTSWSTFHNKTLQLKANFTNATSLTFPYKYNTYMLRRNIYTGAV